MTKNPLMDIEELSTRLKDIYLNDSTKEGTSKCLETFFQDCPLNKIKTATMELITKTHKQITSIKDGNSKDTIHSIFLAFGDWINHNNKNQIHGATSPTNNIWDKCFKIVVYQSPSKIIKSLDYLFCISSPENEKRKGLIESNIRKLLDKEASFSNGIEWIQSFNLDNLRKAEFDNVIYKSFIFDHEEDLDTILTTPDDKLQCLRLLDDCLKRASKQLEPQTETEKTFLNAITAERLPTRIEDLSLEYGIDIEEHKFYACRILFMKEIRSNYTSFDRYSFEMSALEAISGGTVRVKLDFLQVISAKDLKYAYCWAKYLNIPKKNWPKALKNCSQYDADAEKFYKQFKAFYSIDEDCTVNREFWGKSYKLITIVTPKALENFINEYFVESKPPLLGIDCEAGAFEEFEQSKITVLQLATPDWLCLIDVQLLADKLSETQWISLFKQIFYHDITRVGFNFSSDFIFICNRFSFLQPFFQQNSDGKVLCLQKLSNSIVKSYPTVFENSIKHGCGLAELAKETIGIEMNKSSQRCDWTKRPLKYFQKLYAVSDALVVVLIHPKMEAILKERIKFDWMYKSLMERAYVCHK